jgi:hypothetical protein
MPRARALKADLNLECAIARGRPERGAKKIGEVEFGCGVCFPHPGTPPR